MDELQPTNTKTTQRQGSERVPVFLPGTAFVRIIHSSNEVLVPAGRCIGELSAALRQILNIRVGAEVQVNGQPASFADVPIDGDIIEFVKRNGAKGVGHVWTEEQFCELFQIDSQELQKHIAEGLPVLRLRDGSVRITETAVDEFLRGHRLDHQERMAVALENISASQRRLADHLAPAPSDIVDTPYIARHLGCTTQWIAQMVRSGEIPRGCVVPGSGKGRQWKFYRCRIEDWLANK